jgi:hypothetical protein
MRVPRDVDAVRVRGFLVIAVGVYDPGAKDLN